ncbi:hypothetical protein [Paenibacillus ihuae]|uniref:hypothetical protein n=1 Tax=Paenibacillus ihuae TaxID=1232431 RepID=UPI0006D58356|nr:hypothetical protein [Paenibacillus ihuae]
MSKNKKIVFASIGILIALILSVLMIRSPGEKEVAPVPQKQVATAAPEGDYTPKEMSDSHKKVAGIIDDASDAVVTEAPALWGRVIGSWNWVMGFDAKHAVILIGVMIFVFGILATGGGKKRKSD